MPVAPSLNDMIAQGQAEAQDRRPALKFYEGDMTMADLHAAVAMADAVLRFAVRALKATFIDSAERDELDTLVNDHINLQRQAATFAQVTLSWTRTSGGTGGTIPAGTIVGTVFGPDATQVTFSTDVDVIVAPGNNGPYTVLATAQVAGPDGNVAAGTVTQIAGAVFDSTFGVTNPTTAGGGNPKETDDELRVRARSWWQTLRRGTKTALEFGAKTVTSVRNARIAEDTTLGLVRLIVSDSDGNSTLQMVVDVIVAEEEWRAAGVALNVVGGNQVLVDISLGLLVRDGFDVDAASATLVAAATARIKKLVGEEPLYLDMVRTAIEAIYPDDILRTKFLTLVVGGVARSVADDPIVAGVGQVIRPGTITVTKVTT